MNPLADFDGLRREVDRLFASFDAGVAPASRTPAFLPGEAARAYPLLNVYDDAEAVYVSALAPGLDPEKLDVSVRGTTLTVAGEKRHLEGVPREAFHRAERGAGTFVRALELPCEVNEAKVTAEYSHGILMITLPKSDKAKPRKVSVKVA